MPENAGTVPDTVELIVTLGDTTLRFDIPPEALAGDEPDIEAILHAMIAQMPDETNEWRAEQIRKWITDWEDDE